MRSYIGAGLSAILLAGCGGGGEASNASAEEDNAAALAPGEYELSMIVEQVRSTDNTTPMTKLKAGAPAATSRACIAADGAIDPKMFAEGSDQCTVTDNYVRNGRMSVQLKCTRAGQTGHVMQLVDGSFKADSFEARVLGSTGFVASGDYDMTRRMTGRRIGDCPAAGAGQ